MCPLPLEIPEGYVANLLWDGYIEEASRLSEHSEYDKEKIERFRKSKRRLASVVTDGFNVYVDATTLSTASEILFSGEIPNAFTLFDLGIMTASIILFDNVYVPSGSLGARWIDPINKRLEENVVSCLPFDGVAGEIPYTIAANIHTILQNEDIHDELLSEWKKIFDNSTPQSVNFSKVHMVSPEGFSHFLSGLESLDMTFDPTRIDDFIGGSTFRTFFNHELSRILGLSYFPNSARGVIESKIFEMIKMQIPQVDMFLRIVKRKMEIELETVKPEVYIETGLPLLLSVVMQKMKKIEEYFDIVKEFRNKSKGYRKRIKNVIDSTHKGDVKSVVDNVRIVKGGYGMLFDYLKKIGKGAEQTAVCIAPNLSPFLEETINILKAGKYLVSATNDVGLIRRFYTRLFKPHIWFIEDIRSTARRMISLNYGYKKIWKRPLSSENRKILSKISANYPYEGLRTVGNR